MIFHINFEYAILELLDFIVALSNYLNKSFTLFHKIAIMIVAAINSINQKGGERMVQEVSDKELITVTIDRYTDLQQIKKANGGHENEMLDYLIKVTIAKLSSLGVNVEDITL